MGVEDIIGMGRTPRVFAVATAVMAPAVGASSAIAGTVTQPEQPRVTTSRLSGATRRVSVDPATGGVTYRTEYYQFGQVSSFVQPGARRIDSPNLVTYRTNSSNWESITSGLDDVAFLNPDGSKVLVTDNNSSARISFAVESDGSYFGDTIPAGAMTTFVWH